MKVFLILVVRFFVTVAKLLRPGGANGVMAETLIMKHQLLVINRSRKRSPNLTTMDRFLFGFCSLFLNANRIQKVAVIIQTSTLLSFHKALVKRKY